MIAHFVRPKSRGDPAGGKPGALVPERCRIGLLEHCGSGNLGDDGTVAAVIQQIRSRRPAAQLIGLTLDPADTRERHNVPAFPIRHSVFPFKREWAEGPAGRSPSLKDSAKGLLRANKYLFEAAKAVAKVAITPAVKFIREVSFLARSFLVVFELDFLIVCGGGQLLDWGGPWAFPYTILKWVLLARVANVRVWFLNNGAGPLDHALSRWFVRSALRLSDYVSVRDQISCAVLRKIGFRGKVDVVADCAWMVAIPASVKPGGEKAPSNSGLVVGISPMAHCDPDRHWVKDVASYRQLIEKLTEFSRELLARGHRIRLFSSDIWFDDRAISDLQTALSSRCANLHPGDVVRPRVANLEDLLGQMSQVDCYVTCRFHGVLFSHLLTVPALAIAPHPKVSTLMKDCGLSEFCVDIATCNVDALVHKFERLMADADDVKGRIAAQAVSCQSALAMQFAHLFPNRWAARDALRQGAFT
jgi:polysaccharide pyruvyl transferase WcaK-like protein